MKLLFVINQRFFLLFFIVFFSYKTTYGQNLSDTINLEKPNRNLIHATIGIAGLAGTYHVNYERMLIGFEKGTLAGLWSKVGVGGWGVWSAGGPYQSISVGILTGPHRNHFELNAGVARMFNRIGFEREQSLSTQLSEPQPFKSGYVNVSLVGTAGYRYQKPDGSFMFRSGLGYPEIIYVGFGVAF